MAIHKKIGVRRITKDHLPVCILDMEAMGTGEICSPHVAVANIGETYVACKEDIGRLHSCSFYMVLWVTEGHCNYIFHMRHYNIRPNTIILLKCGALHRFANIDGLNGTILFFAPEVLLNVSPKLSDQIALDLFTNNPVIPVTSQPTQEMLKVTLNNLCHTCTVTSQGGYIGQEIIKLEVLVFLLKLLESQEVQDNTATNARNRNLYHIFVQFQKKVDEKHQSLHKVQDYAKLLNISTKHLTKCIREHTGKSPRQVINERLILQAQRLLLLSRLSIKEIAFNLGFLDTSHFATFFKRETGVYPSEYQRNR